MSDIGDWFNNLKDKIEGWFEGLKPDAQKAVHWGVMATDLLKKFEDSGAGDFIARLIENFKVVGTIPTDVNDAIIKELPAIMIGLKLSDNCKDLTNPEEILRTSIAAFQEVDPQFQKDFADAIATRITMIASDGNMSWSDSKIAAKFYYDNKYKA